MPFQIARVLIASRVVVHDPDRKLPEGEVLSDEQAVAHVARGVLLLPYDVRVAGDAVGTAVAYQRRSFGYGVPFASRLPERGCALPVYFPSPSGAVRVHWVARVLHEDDAGGQLALASGPEFNLGVSQADQGSEMQGRGVAHLFGSAVVRSGGAGTWATLCLAGSCSGLRVAWLAMTVCSS